MQWPGARKIPIMIGLQPSENELDAARALVRLWRERSQSLEAQRLRDLRALTQADAAQRFAKLLCGASAARPDSGLVEQQRIFSRLRRAPE